MKRLIALCCLAASSCLSLHADPLLYIMSIPTTYIDANGGIRTNSGPSVVYQVDAATGGATALNTFARGDVTFGEGVAVIGSTMYYTTLRDNNVYSFDLATGISGIAFTITDNNRKYPSADTLSSITYDGTNFWIGDNYHASLPGDTSHIYEVSPNGTVLKTIQLANCTFDCQLEYFARDGVGYLISNRGYGAGPYDIYSLDGTLLTSDFIDGSQNASGNTGLRGPNTGIAYDGKYFYTSGPNLHDLIQWDGATGAYINVIPLHTCIFCYGDDPLIYQTFEDISVGYPSPNTSTATPEPSSFILLGSGLLAMAAIVRHRMHASQQR